MSCADLLEMKATLMMDSMILIVNNSLFNTSYNYVVLIFIQKSWKASKINKLCIWGVMCWFVENENNSNSGADDFDF